MQQEKRPMSVDLGEPVGEEIGEPLGEPLSGVRPHLYGDTAEQATQLAETVSWAFICWAERGLQKCGS
jgi:hypothetical protein